MRTGAVVLVIWLLIGVFAAYQRNYFSGDSQVNCSEFGTVALTIVAGPLNYFGLNPQARCELPQPSQ